MNRLSTKYNLSEPQKKNLQQFRDLIAKCRNIVGFFNHSGSLQHELVNFETVDGKQLKKTIQEVATRWNSTYAMVKRLHEQAGPVNMLFNEFSQE
jgi:hypothetical protein